MGSLRPDGRTLHDAVCLPCASMHAGPRNSYNTHNGGGLGLGPVLLFLLVLLPLPMLSWPTYGAWLRPWSLIGLHVAPGYGGGRWLTYMWRLATVVVVDAKGCGN